MVNDLSPTPLVERFLPDQRLLPLSYVNEEWRRQLYRFDLQRFPEAFYDILGRFYCFLLNKHFRSFRQANVIVSCLVGHLKVSVGDYEDCGLHGADLVEVTHAYEPPGTRALEQLTCDAQAKTIHDAYGRVIGGVRDVYENRHELAELRKFWDSNGPLSGRDNLHAMMPLVRRLLYAKLSRVIPNLREEQLVARAIGRGLDKVVTLHTNLVRENMPGVDVSTYVLICFADTNFYLDSLESYYTAITWELYKQAIKQYRGVWQGRSSLLTP